MIDDRKNEQSPSRFSLEGKRVWVAGHRGMVGSAMVRRLAEENCEIVVVDRKDLNLIDQFAVKSWMKCNAPEVIVIAAAKVGGILANCQQPVNFLYENLMIEANIMQTASEIGVPRLLFLGSSCIYPKYSDQPIKEVDLLSGPLEPTNEWYAVAKIAGLKLVQAYRKQHGAEWISAMPTNLYGPGDNYDPKSSHVMAALIRKVHEARMANSRTITLWGTGRPRREFLHCDDLADALVFLLKNYSGDLPLNIGSGEETSILDLSTMISEIVGHPIEVDFDTTQPDGTPRKLLDCSALSNLGWDNARPLRIGIEQTYKSLAPHYFRFDAAS